MEGKYPEKPSAGNGYSVLTVLPTPDYPRAVAGWFAVEPGKSHSVTRPPKKRPNSKDNDVWFFVYRDGKFLKPSEQKFKNMELMWCHPKLKFHLASNDGAFLTSGSLEGSSFTLPRNYQQYERTLKNKGFVKVQSSKVPVGTTKVNIENWNFQ